VSERPLPDAGHELYGPHWAAAADGRLAMQQCEACGYVRWPPEPLCPECLTEGGRWTDLPLQGTVWSVAVYEHAYHPAFREELPYTCALVELDGGPSLVTRLVDVDPTDVEIGMPVSAVFPEVAGGIRLVCFAPVTAPVAIPDSDS
jgi:uncharacterized OB-fold protein